MDAVTMTELKGKYIDTAEERTLGGRRHRSTRKNYKKSGKRAKSRRTRRRHK